MESPITVLQTKALEGNTFPLVASFRDETGTLVTPNTGSLTWRLSDLAGNIMNGRSAVSIDSASSVYIVLDEDDTLVGDYGTERLVVVKGTYNSVTLGSNKRIKAAVKFFIEPIPGGP